MGSIGKWAYEQEERDAREEAVRQRAIDLERGWTIDSVRGKEIRHQVLKKGRELRLLRLVIAGTPDGHKTLPDLYQKEAVLEHTINFFKTPGEPGYDMWKHYKFAVTCEEDFGDSDG